MAERNAEPGATRVCPHCKSTVLASAAICPGCQHHLRFAGPGEVKPGVAGYPALRFEGSFAHPQRESACEYSVVLAVLNERGEKLTRQVIDVGALRPGETRTVSLSVEIVPPANKVQAPQTKRPGIAPGPSTHAQRGVRG